MTEQAWEPVNGADAVWLRLERADNPMVITAMAVTDPMRPADLRRLIRERFLTVERFGWTPVNHSGIWLWEPDAEFDLDFHVRHVALPGAADDAALATLVGDLMSQPLAENHPLWQFVLIDGYGDRSVIVMRVHHCYADGLSLAALFGAMSDDAPNVRPLAPRRAAESRPDPGLAVRYHGIRDTLRRALERITSISGEWSEKAARLMALADNGQSAGQVAAAGLAEVAQLLALPPESPSPLTGQRLSPLKRVAWSDTIPLTELKRTARALGGTVNDVLLGGVSAGLADWIGSRGDEAPSRLTAAGQPAAAGNGRSTGQSAGYGQSFRAGAGAAGPECRQPSGAAVPGAVRGGAVETVLAAGTGAHHDEHHRPDAGAAGYGAGSDRSAGIAGVVQCAGCASPPLSHGPKGA